MRRRALLGGLAGLASLTGCNADGNDPATTATTQTTAPPADTATTKAHTETTTTQESTTRDPTTQASETTTTTRREPSFPRFVDAESVSGPDHSDLEFDVRVESNRIDATRTAALTSVLENTGDQTLEFEMGYRPPFSIVMSKDGGYILVKSTANGALDACWEPKRHGQPPLLARPTLASGEILTNAMKVWSDPQSASCLPTGKFRFLNEFELVTGDEKQTLTNALTLKITGD